MQYLEYRSLTRSLVASNNIFLSTDQFTERLGFYKIGFQLLIKLGD